MSGASGRTCGSGSALGRGGEAGWLKSIGVGGTLQPPGVYDLVLSDGADASGTAEYAVHPLRPTGVGSGPGSELRKRVHPVRGFDKGQANIETFMRDFA